MVIIATNFHMRFPKEVQLSGKSGILDKPLSEQLDIVKGKIEKLLSIPVDLKGIRIIELDSTSFRDTKIAKLLEVQKIAQPQSFFANQDKGNRSFINSLTGIYYYLMDSVIYLQKTENIFLRQLTLVNVIIKRSLSCKTTVSPKYQNENSLMRNTVLYYYSDLFTARYLNSAVVIGAVVVRQLETTECILKISVSGFPFCSYIETSNSLMNKIKVDTNFSYKEAERMNAFLKMGNDLITKNWFKSINFQFWDLYHSFELCKNIDVSTLIDIHLLGEVMFIFPDSIRLKYHISAYNYSSFKSTNALQLTLSLFIGVLDASLKNPRSYSKNERKTKIASESFNTIKITLISDRINWNRIAASESCKTNLAKAISELEKN